MARKGRALAYLPFTLTQGANDAFVQAAISTALFGQTKTCYRLASIEFEFPLLSANAGDLQFALTRKSYAAFPVNMLLEKSAIYYTRRRSSFTTSGLVMEELVLTKTWSDDDAPILVEDPLYVQYDSANTGATNIGYGRLGYWIDTISEVDRLQLVANSLS